ncbi:MAG: hypothetical protein ACYDC2_09920 [Solirubrobacteraceae bacterium]
MPRPTKLTAKLADKLVKLVEDGNYVLVAASACGIGRQTFYDWQKRGEKALALALDPEPKPIPESERPFAELAERLDTAAAKAEVDALAMVRKQSKLWQASMTFLERRFPDRWGRRQAIEHSGPQGGAITHAISPDLLAKASNEFLKAVTEGRAVDAGALRPADPSGPDRSGEHPGGTG